MKTSFSPLILLALVLLISSVSAQKTISGSLKGTVVYATNSPQGNENAKPVPANLKNAVSQKSPYKHFYLVGSDTKSIRAGAVSELRPTSQITLAFQPSGSGVAIDYIQGGKKAFSTKAALTAGTPFIISGPNWRDGKLIIILEHSK